MRISQEPRKEGTEEGNEESRLRPSANPSHLERRLREVEDEAMDAIDSAQIRADDREVRVGQIFDGLQLDHDLVADQEIQPVKTNDLAMVEHGHANLSFERDVPLAELDRERVLVHRLDEAGAQASVDFDSSPNEGAGDLFGLERHRAPPGFLPSWVPEMVPRPRAVVARPQGRESPMLTASTTGVDLAAWPTSFSATPTASSESSRATTG